MADVSPRKRAPEVRPRRAVARLCVAGSTSNRSRRRLRRREPAGGAGAPSSAVPQRRLIESSFPVFLGDADQRVQRLLQPSHEHVDTQRRGVEYPQTNTEIAPPKSPLVSPSAVPSMTPRAMNASAIHLRTPIVYTRRAAPAVLTAPPDLAISFPPPSPSEQQNGRRRLGSPAAIRGVVQQPATTLASDPRKAYLSRPLVNLDCAGRTVAPGGAPVQSRTSVTKPPLTDIQGVGERRMCVFGRRFERTRNEEVRVSPVHGRRACAAPRRGAAKGQEEPPWPGPRRGSRKEVGTRNRAPSEVPAGQPPHW